MNKQRFEFSTPWKLWEEDCNPGEDQRGRKKSVWNRLAQRVLPDLALQLQGRVDFDAPLPEAHPLWTYARLAEFTADTGKKASGWAAAIQAFFHACVSPSLRDARASRSPRAAAAALVAAGGAEAAWGDAVARLQKL